MTEIPRADSQQPEPGLSTLLGIMLCSMSAISFEIALTRIFSITLWYHFAFMVISMGMLGMGFSGTLQSIFPGLRDIGRLGLYALLLSVFIPSSYVLSNQLPLDPVRLQWDRIQIAYMGLYYLMLALPFFFFGLIVAASLGAYSGRSGLVYGADLLGAGAGALSIIPIIGVAGPDRSFIAISLIGLAGAFVLGARRSAVIAGAAILSFALAAPGLMKPRMSEFKELSLALKYPGAEHVRTYRDGYSQVDVFRSPMARYAPGLSLRYKGELPPQLGITVDGSGITAVTDPREGASFLEYLPQALPYVVRESHDPPDVLVAEPDGGLSVLLARQYGAATVYGVESNPLIVRALRDDLGARSGDVYGRNAYVGLARNWLVGSGMKFDVIDVSLMGALAYGSFGISEDYRYTVEAFRTYLSHLSEGGFISLSAYVIPPPRAEFRLLLTALKAMEDSGIVRPDLNVAAIRSWGSICLIVKKSPLSPGEIDNIRNFSAARGFDLVYYPGVSETETNIYVVTEGNEYARAYARLISPNTRDGFIENYVFDISETYDDRPFFHYYLKLTNLKVIYEVMGRKWQYFIQEGYLLPVILLQAGVLSLLLLLLPWASGRGRGTRPSVSLLYFAFLGLGFMFIEVPLIQRMILPFENPYRSVALVIAAILISSGIGSILGQRYRGMGRPRSLLLLAAASLLYGALLQPLAGYLPGLPLALRVMIAFCIIMPSGLLMGIPFPLGIRALGRKRPDLIPWAWAVNGCFSVLGPIIASMLALTYGFSMIFILGAIMYIFAFVIIANMIDRIPEKC